MADVYLDTEFFGDNRFGFAAEALREHRFITEMRVVRCWHHCFSNLTPSLTIRDIRVQAQWAGDPAALIATFVEAGICDDNGDGTYSFHGVPQRVQLIKEGIERAREAGKRGAEIRWRGHEERARRKAAPTEAASVPMADPIGPLSAPMGSDGGRIATVQTVQTDREENISTPESSPRGERDPASKPKKSKPDPKPSDDPDDVAIAEAWAEYARQASKTVRPQIALWSQTVRQMREKDGLTHAEIRSLLAFVRDDARFWRSQAVSLPAMRSRSQNGLLKHENARQSLDRAKAETKPEAPKKPERKVYTTLEELEELI